MFNNHFFVNGRLEILEAVSSNNLAKVRAMLLMQPRLIAAKTTTAGSSLLHIAAERGYTELCSLLFDKGHETDLCDKQGKTPYQRAGLEAIKDMLVCFRSNFLNDEFFPSAHIPDPNQPFIISVEREVIILSKHDMLNHPLNGRGAATLSLTAMGSGTSGHYNLLTLVREDIFMTPYYGELLITYANEQVTQFLEELEHSKDGRIQKERNPIQTVRSYMKSIATAFERYPFLKEYPKQDDLPEVVEAKKMFVNFAVLELVEHINKCSAEQLEQLKSLEHYDAIMAHTLKIISNENREINRTICQEMHEKYASEESVTEDVCTSSSLAM